MWVYEGPRHMEGKTVGREGLRQGVIVIEKLCEGV